MMANIKFALISLAFFPELYEKSHLIVTHCIFNKTLQQPLEL